MPCMIYVNIDQGIHKGKKDAGLGICSFSVFDSIWNTNNEKWSTELVQFRWVTNPKYDRCDYTLEWRNSALLQNCTFFLILAHCDIHAFGCCVLYPFLCIDAIIMDILSLFLNKTNTNHLWSIQCCFDMTRSRFTNVCT